MAFPSRWRSTLIGIPVRGRSTAIRLTEGPVAWARLDLLLPVAIALVALAARLPYLWDVPRYTDEVREVDIALSIARGTLLPLTNFDAYMGAFFNYVLAGLVLVFGADPHLPRLFTAVTSASTVGLTYALGRRMADRWIGLVAALLVAGNAPDIVEGAHVAYSHSLTPLLTTVALWLFWEAFNTAARPAPTTAVAGPFSSLTRQRRLFFGGALYLGVAFQTHPSVVALAPGIVICFFLSKVRSPGLGVGAAFAAVCLFALGCFNLIVYNVATGGDGIRSGLSQREYYAGGHSLALDAYPGAFVTGLRALADVVDAAIAAESPIPHQLDLVISIGSIGLLVAGLLLLAIQRKVFVPAILIAWSIVLPLLTAYRTDYHRYWLPILPVAAIASATALVYLTRNAGSGWPRVPVTAASVVAVAILVTHSWPSLNRLYQVRSVVHPTNAELDHLAESMSANAHPGERAIVDGNLFAKKVSDETEETRTLVHLLSFRGVVATRAWGARDILLTVLGAGPGATMLVVSPEPVVRQLNGALVHEDLPGEAASIPGQSVAVARLRGARAPSAESNSSPSGLDAIFGGRIRLLGYQGSGGLLHCGDGLPLTLYWMRIGPVDVDYTVFTHLTVGDRTIGQQDGQPLGGRFPTTTWGNSQVVADDYLIPVAPTCGDGLPGKNPVPVNVVVGLYDAKTMQRLSVADNHGETGRDFVELPAKLTVARADGP